MTIRPIQRNELEVFARFSPEDELNAMLKDNVMTLWEEGANRPEWCFVAEENGQIVGRIGYWGLPSFSNPSVVELLLLPWDGNYLEIGTALLRQTLALFHAQCVQTMKYLLPIPSRLHAHPAQRVEVLEHVGFSLRREADRWECTDTTAPLEPCRHAEDPVRVCAGDLHVPAAVPVEERADLIRGVGDVAI